MVLTLLIAWVLCSIPVAFVLAALFRLRAQPLVPRYATVVSGSVRRKAA